MPRMLLHALSIARRSGSREEVFEVVWGFTRGVLAEGIRLGMLQSRQPTLTRRSRAQCRPEVFALVWVVAGTVNLYQTANW